MVYISRRYAGWFDGVDDYVDFGTNVALPTDALTIELYFRILHFGDSTILGARLGFYDEYGFNIRVDTPTNRFWLIVGDGSVDYSSHSYYPSIGELVHVVYVVDSSSIKTYINGVLYGTTTNAPSQILYQDGVSLTLGSLGETHYTKMEVYTLKIWNRTLTDSEISKLSEDPFDPDNVPKDGLVGWWDFNKADWTNGMLPDLSGNGNDGQINGVVQRDVLVKRGTGDLPEYDLLWSWVCDGIDDYVIVDFNNWAVTKALCFVVWDNTYAGIWRDCIVKDHAIGIGHYDVDKDVWRVDAGEVGYFVDMDFEYDETLHGRGIWFYVNKVQVDDNSVAEKLFRFEVVDVSSGEVIFTHDYMANQFPDDSLSGIKTAGYKFMPYGRYKLRLYSYGNVGFWIGYARMEGIHGALLYSYNSNDFKIYRYFSKIKFYVYKTDGSYVSKMFSDDIIRMFEHFVVGWSNVEQKFVGYLNGEFLGEKNDTAGLDMRGAVTQIIFGSSTKMTVSNRYTGEIASVMLFDRLLDDAEVSDLYNRKFVLDGLVHWWVVDENGNLVDLVTGNSYEIQGDPWIRRLYDSDSRLNSGNGVIVFDIIREERGQ